jgi:phospholipase/carboxylesterase
MTDPVVFLHGRGLGSETAAEVASAFPGAELIAPTGGVGLRRGQTWFENVAVGVAREDSVRAAEDRFLAWRASSPLNGRPALLCGFSNGGAFAAHLLMRHPALFTGAVLLSAPLVLPPWPVGALAGKPVFYGHGRARDTVVGASFYEAAEAYLLGASGCEATIRHYDIGHAIEAPVIADLAAWYQTQDHGPEDKG